jgi:predicted PurR-regulated permease PerM
MLSFILGVIVGILLSLVAIISNKIGALVKKIPEKLSRQDATIVETTDLLDQIDLK